MSKQETDIPPGLAWEHFEEPESVQMLWRVSYFRRTKSGNAIRCTDYFTDEKQAWEFSLRRIDKGDEVVKVLKLAVSA